jgi:signal transduction histidine kinase
VTTIRQRLTRRVLLAFGVPLIIAAVAVYGLVREALIESFDAALRNKALTLVALTREADLQLEVDASNRLLRDFDQAAEGEAHRVASETSDAAYFEMWTQDGTAVRRSRSLGGRDLVVATSTSARALFVNLNLPSGRSGRAVQLTFTPRRREESDSEPVATSGRPVRLVVAVDREDLDQTEQVVAVVLAGAGIILLATTFFLVPRVITREFAPLGALADRAAQITAVSLGTRFPTESLPGELAPIAARLNDLLGRLEHAFERERQFSADLAHELRTPIAELRSLAEVGIRWPDARSEDADRDSLAIAVQMEGIVTRLLTLLRSERGQVIVVPAQIDLADLVSRRWRALEGRANARGLRLDLRRPSDVTITSDPVLLAAILNNLLENAVDYATRGTDIGVELKVDETQFAVSVQNDTADLTPQDLDEMFTRFWRRDRARAGGEHSGLGLSLARAFAETLACDLRAQLDGSSLRMTLTGPREFRPLS